jgi:hypothetical protein
MGHKINPQIFRLGTSVDWKYQLRDPLLANIFIYRLVRSLVFRYSAPYIRYNVGRKTNEPHYYSLYPVIRLKRGELLDKEHVPAMFAGKKRMIHNPFIHRSFVLSHLNISYSPSLFISIFLLDGGAEHKRAKKKLRENYFYYLSGKVIKRSRRFQSYFRTYMFMRKTFKVKKRAYSIRYYYLMRSFLNSRMMALRTEAIKTKIKRRVQNKKKKLRRRRNRTARVIPIPESTKPIRTRYLTNLYHKASILKKIKNLSLYYQKKQKFIIKSKNYYQRIRLIRPIRRRQYRIKCKRIVKLHKANVLRMRVFNKSIKKVRRKKKCVNTNKSVSKKSFIVKVKNRKRKAKTKKIIKVKPKKKIRYKIYRRKRYSFFKPKFLRLVRRIFIKNRKFFFKKLKIRKKSPFKHFWIQRSTRKQSKLKAKNSSSVRAHIKKLLKPYPFYRFGRRARKLKKKYKKKRIRYYRGYDHKTRSRIVRFKPNTLITYKRFPVWFAGFIRLMYYKRTSYRILKNLRILKFLLRYFKYYNQILSKKRLLFFHLLISTLSALITILPKGIFTNRLFVFLHLCYFYLYSFKYLHFQYNKDIYQLRFMRFNLLSKFVLFSLKKVSFISTDNKLILRYYGLHNRSFNAQFFLNFIIHKLGQYFRINTILNPIINRLNRLYVVKGYRFIISGRLTRRERAAFIVRSARAMPLSTKSVRIDAAQDFKIMKFGIVGIKIYLLYDKTPPYYYLFEFRNKLES